jgi:DNA-binding transcriptional ArsR family regulator
MSIDLQWAVLRSKLPAHLKPIALILALIAKDDGSGIYVRTSKLAEYLGLTRFTVGHQLAALAQRGIIETVKRGGRWAGKTGKVTGRSTVRQLHAVALERFGCDAHRTYVRDDVTPASLDAPDHVTPTSPDSADHVTPTSPIKTVKLIETVNPRTERPSYKRKKVCKTPSPAAPASSANPVAASPVTRCMSEFKAAFQSRFGNQPLIEHGKDESRIKQMVQVYGESRVLMLVPRFFNSSDPRILQSDYTVGDFYRRAQGLNIGPRLGERTAANVDAAARASGKGDL